MIKKFLGLKCSVGIMGGSKSRAYYFVGYTGNSLLYLDPHYSRPYNLSNKIKQKLP